MQQFHKHSIHILISLFLLLIALAIISRWNTANATEPVETIVVGEEIEWTHYDEFNRIYEQTDIYILHKDICKTVSKSPLCSDFELLKRVDDIAKSKNVPTRLLIGITYAESHVGIAFNRPACKEYHNWSWTKWRKHDNWRVEWFTKNRKADGNGCYLFKFNSVEEWFHSLANTISIWYSGCNNNVRCISRSYVGSPTVEEQSWINNVAKFYE